MSVISDYMIRKLSPPVLERLPDFDTLFAARIDQMRQLWPDWDGYQIRSDPINIICRHAAYGDLLYIQELNETFLASLRDFASGADLDAKARDFGLTRIMGEDDASLRRRLEERQKGQSGAGSDNWYANAAFSAAPDRVADVAVSGDGSGNVTIAILSKDAGGVADPALLSLIETALNQPQIRIENDRLHIVSAIIANVDISAKLWLLPDASPDTLARAEAHLREGFASARQLAWDLNRSWIIANLFVPGVQNVELSSPSHDLSVDFNQAVALHSVLLLDQGRAF